MNIWVERSKRLLTMAGATLPSTLPLDVDIAVNYVQLGRWMKDRRFEASIRLATREECWERMAAIIGSRPVLYLEFGVFEGNSIKYWSKLLRHSDSQLHGFDSFEGLPESFDERLRLPRGAFNVGGQIPLVDDPRITFHKGWFADTLPKFQVPRHDRLVITLDADLYSSTRTVLEYLDPWIVPGTFIYFDDFAHMEHEPKAFDEYMKASGKRFKLAFTVRGLNRSVFIGWEYQTRNDGQPRPVSGCLHRAYVTSGTVDPKFGVDRPDDETDLVLPANLGDRLYEVPAHRLEVGGSPLRRYIGLAPCATGGYDILSAQAAESLNEFNPPARRTNQHVHYSRR